MFLKKIFYVSFFVSLMVFCGCKGKDTEQGPEAASVPEDIIADAAPKAGGFSLSDQNGNKVSLADFAGKTVVLEWLNYDCPFVMAHYESGTMKNLAEKSSLLEVKPLHLCQILNRWRAEVIAL